MYFLQGCFCNRQRRFSEIESRICRHWCFKLKTTMHFWEAWHFTTQFKLNIFSAKMHGRFHFHLHCALGKFMTHATNLVRRTCFRTLVWHLSGDKIWSVSCFPLPSRHELPWPWVQREMPAPETAPIQCQPNALFKWELDQTAVCYMSLDGSFSVNDFKPKIMGICFPVMSCLSCSRSHLGTPCWVVSCGLWQLSPGLKSPCLPWTGLTAYSVTKKRGGLAKTCWRSSFLTVSSKKISYKKLGRNCHHQQLKQ